MRERGKKFWNKIIDCIMILFFKKYVGFKKKRRENKNCYF